MKKIYSLIVLFAGLLAFAPAVIAQQVVTDKDIDGPDNNGVYTISIDAFVTGSKITTQELVPMDIVLCLAYNNSMYHDSGQIQSLRRSVATFIDIIKEKDIKKNEDGTPTGERVGYRVALDLYGVKVEDYRSGTDLPADTYNKLIDVQQYVASKADSDGYLKRVGYDDDLFPRSGSYFTGNEKSNDGMSRALTILEGANDLQDNSVVVFFTNGTPGAQSGSGWNDGKDNSVAKACLDVSYNIKNSTTAHPTSSTVIAVGFGEGGPTKMTDWLYLTSSDKVDATSASLFDNPLKDVTGINSMLASVNTLESIFASIASSIGGDYNIGSASSVLIDVVSTSFNIPTNADLGSVKVYKVPCNITTDKTVIHPQNDFAAITPAMEMNTVNTESETYPANTVYLKTDYSNQSVTVMGFDYGENWCGWEVEDGVGHAHGYKLTLQIPIMANVDAVGGPSVATNAEGSGITIKDKDGNQVGDPILFVSPKVSLPVNIYIEKSGLDPGESAKFMIERAILYNGMVEPERYEEDLDWDYVSTVFVTEKGVNATERQGYMKESVDGNPMVKVRGLPAEIEVEGERYGVLYRVSEEEWSWSYKPDTAPQYTDTYHVENPFTFSNTKKPNIDFEVRHAESKATNIFKAGGGAKYDDSKTNDRSNDPTTP